MRFRKICNICKRIMKEACDESYAKTTMRDHKALCSDCRNLGTRYAAMNDDIE